jgi:MtN3 and saliva related transmembrane protein
MPWETFIGSTAALFTTLSYIPQVRKTWSSGETGDISLKMLLLLATGLALWLTYGLMKADWVIVAANSSSLALVLVVLSFKVRAHATAGA